MCNWRLGELPALGIRRRIRWPHTPEDGRLHRAAVDSSFGASRRKAFPMGSVSALSFQECRFTRGSHRSRDFSDSGTLFLSFTFFGILNSLHFLLRGSGTEQRAAQLSLWLPAPPLAARVPWPRLLRLHSEGLQVRSAHLTSCCTEGRERAAAELA